MSHLINILLDPGKVFPELKHNPTFLVPALLTAVLTALAATAYFVNVDPDWFASQQIQTVGADMSKDEIRQVSKMMPSARTMIWITAPVALLTMAISYMILSFYYWLAGKVTGNLLSYKQGLSLAAWSGMPMLIGAVVALIAVYTSSSQSSYESMQLLNIDPLFVQLPMDHDWSRMAKSFSLLNFWAWFVASLGWKTWFETSWAQALAVVLLPQFVIYGGMSLFALI